MTVGVSGTHNCSLRMMEAPLIESDEEAEKLEFAVARFRVLITQIPFVYAIILINLIAVVITQGRHAPVWLSYYVPGGLVVIAVLRALQLLRVRHQDVTPDQAHKGITRTFVMICLLGPVFTTWALLLHAYGGPATDGQIAFFLGATLMPVMAGLALVRHAGLVAFFTVALPSAVHYFMLNDPPAQAIAINLVVASAAMLALNHRSFVDFKASFDKSFTLEQQQIKLQQLNEEVSRLASEDSLTGLPNRRSFFARLDELIENRNKANGPAFAIGILDLDGFKPVNDIFGHVAGDELLRQAGIRMSNALPEGSFVARVGGDEFAIILDPATSEAHLLDSGLGVLNALKPAFVLNDGATSVSATLGLARYPEAGTTSEALFEHADYTLYFTKQRNRGEVSIYSSEHAQVIREVGLIAQRLREADLEDELSVVFQPIIDSRSGRTQGFEALARWTNPIMGVVSPNLFIRSAEQSGMISQLTLVLLRKALEVAAMWPASTYLSFNLSSFDLCSEQAVGRIIETVYQSEVPMKRMVFEVTESAVMQDVDRAVAGLNQLKKAGAAIALDDFGTGFSSLSYVRDLPIDRLKIDGSFVKGIEDDHATRNIVRAIADLCADLDLDCIVEAVETEGQLKVLEELGCYLIQGYYFSRPLDASAAARYALVDQRLKAAV